MAWTSTDSVDEFLAAAGGFLAAHPAENTVLLTVTERLVQAGPVTFGNEPAAFGWWREHDGDPVSGAFLVTPPYPLRLSLMPDHAAAELGAEPGLSPSSVAGQCPTVDAFTEAWTSATGGTTRVQLRERQYRLAELAAPTDTPGGSRRAGADDRPLILAWFDAFYSELGGTLGDLAGAVDSRLVAGAVHLWENEGEPTSLAGTSPVVAGMARIGPVYTPSELRGHGYASAVTAAASADALARGADQVLLYTDLANPISNSIYQKIGYRPIGDEVIVDLERP